MKKYSSMRGQIDRLKYSIKHSIRPFDGDGYVFKTALAELRKEGIVIKYNRVKCHYTIVTEKPH